MLVGNFGDGTINAFNPITFANDGPLVDASGRTIAIDGLWGLIAGNGTQGSANSIFFTAGSNGEQDGLFGSIAPVPEPSTAIMLFAGGAALGAWRLKRRVARSGDRPQRRVTGYNGPRNHNRNRNPNRIGTSSRKQNFDYDYEYDYD